jgi:uncharacterized membrane protein YheB (UPF0754 family)
MEIDARFLLIPLIAGAIGYGTNWVAVKMLFFPVTFVGFRLPGLAVLSSYLPRRIRAVPGVAEGGVGWQGIVPSRAAKMGSIAVDKGVAKLGSPREFYDQLEPDRIAEHIVTTSREEIWELVVEIIEREHPQLWAGLPPPVKSRVRARMEEHLPVLVKEITDDIGEEIDQLLDIKLMVIRRIERQPELANRIFLEVGRKEMDFIVRSGFLFGFLLGIPQIPLFAALEHWWVLPLGGLVVGYLTNALALRVIFEPVRPRRIGPFTIQGLFMRRQPEVAGVYSRIIADDVVSLENIGDELMHGRRSDRTRWMISTRLRPAVDRALGRARPAVRIAVGGHDYDAIRDSLADGAVDHTLAPLGDPAFSHRQSDAVRELLEARMQTMPPEDYAELLRTAIIEDEWMLISLGAVLGFGAGVLQIAFLF